MIIDSIFLDIQDLPIGRYVVQWKRNDNCEQEIESYAKTTFEMPIVKVAVSSLYITSELPPYGVVRTPLTLSYNLTNRTDLLQELLVIMEPSDAFMFSGNKQLHIKILPGRSYKLNYVLYPLLPGESVILPQLKLSSIRLTLTEDLSSTIQRLVPKSITVLPKARSKMSNEHGEKKEDIVGVEEDQSHFTVIDPFFVSNKLVPRTIR